MAALETRACAVIDCAVWKAVQLVNLSLSILSALTDDSEGKRTFTCINMALYFSPSRYSCQ